MQRAVLYKFTVLVSLSSMSKRKLKDVCQHPNLKSNGKEERAGRHTLRLLFAHLQKWFLRSSLSQQWTNLHSYTSLRNEYRCVLLQTLDVAGHLEPVVALNATVILSLKIEVTETLI